MKIVRTVYHIDGKDFEENQRVNFNFFLPKNSIQSFLDLCRVKRVFIESISKTFQSDGTKLIKTVSYPSDLYQLAYYLGVREWHTLQNGWTLTHSILKLERFKAKHYGYMCYNPATKTTELKTNSPFVIKGIQQVFNGKLWRRIKNHQNR
jgi:hypothetical protein